MNQVWICAFHFLCIGVVYNTFDCSVHIQVICLKALSVSQDGVLVDEFGLPQIPAT